MVKLAQACLINFLSLGIAFIAQDAYGSPSLGKAPVILYANASNWGSLAPGYKLCSTGSRQSPIDIQSKRTVQNKHQQLYPQRVSTDVSKASLSNNGVTLQLSVTGKNDINVDDKDYRLLNIRWHTPSEHSIDGARYDAEMHQVYVASDGSGQMAIIATLYKTGPKDDPILAAIKEEMGKLSKGGGGEQNVTPNKLTADLLKNIPADKYYRYDGSITYPPCIEQVTWFIVPTVLPISKAQVQALQGFVKRPDKTNARPAQPIKTRVVLAVVPGPAPRARLA